MVWDRWKKEKNPFAGGFASGGTGRLYRDPWTHDLTNRKQDTSSWSYRQGWDQNKCKDENSCGSGFSCIDGQCVKVWTSDGSNFQPSTCGDNPVSWAPCKKSNQKSTSNDGCTKPSCGEEKDPECPGDKCCRQRRDGSIRCVCGSCEQTDTGVCNVWCDAEYKNYGEVRAGCFTKDMDGFGECGGNICDECQFCEDNIFGSGGICTLGEQDDPFNPLPCHCFSKCAEECNKCDKSESSPTFGECYYEEEGCMQCCTQYNYDCPQCAKYIPVAHHCEPVTSGKPCITALREKLYKQCEEDCKSEKDPCRSTGSTSFCDDPGVPLRPNSDPTFNLGGPDGLPCPAPGKGCDYAGYMTVGDTNCYFWNTYDPDILAERGCSCDTPECNCHSECGDCQTCNDNGECVDDPQCDLQQAGWWRWSGTCNGAVAKSGWTELTQSDINNQVYLTLWASFSAAEQTNFTPNTLGVAIGTEWFAGPYEVTRRSATCSNLYGSPTVWRGVAGNPTSSAQGAGKLGYDPNLGAFIPEVPSCDDAPGYKATFTGGWEYGGQSVDPPPF